MVKRNVTFSCLKTIAKDKKAGIYISILNYLIRFILSILSSLTNDYIYQYHKKYSTTPIILLRSYIYSNLKAHIGHSN